ncbi:hypothetical protein ACI65C_000093 [Semiaphis heraclei]
MSSTIFKTYAIFVVLCIFMTLIQNSSQAGEDDCFELKTVIDEINKKGESSRSMQHTIEDDEETYAAGMDLKPRTSSFHEFEIKGGILDESSSLQNRIDESSSLQNRIDESSSLQNRIGESKKSQDRKEKKNRSGKKSNIALCCGSIQTIDDE